ncbi:hypothetical protein Tco_0456218 [Tanacetum coccineum]
MDMKLSSALESNNTLDRCWFRRNIPVTTFGSWHDKVMSVGSDYFSGWPFWFLCSLVRWPTLIASITLNSLIYQGSFVMQSAFLIQRTVSSIPIVFSWGGSISPKGFLSSVLLWLVIIVAVVGVGVMVVVVVESFFLSANFHFVINLILATEGCFVTDPLASGLC